jgi:hypothetical protein
LVRVCSLELGSEGSGVGAVWSDLLISDVPAGSLVRVFFVENVLGRVVEEGAEGSVGVVEEGVAFGVDGGGALAWLHLVRVVVPVEGRRLPVVNSVVQVLEGHLVVSTPFLGVLLPDHLDHSGPLVLLSRFFV